MAIDFKDVITFKTKDGGRIGIPRAAIMSIKTKMEKDYGATPTQDKEITQLFVNIEVAKMLGVEVERFERNAVGAFISIGDKYEIALAIMQGKPGVEVLF